MESSLPATALDEPSTFSVFGRKINISLKSYLHVYLIVGGGLVISVLANEHLNFAAGLHPAVLKALETVRQSEELRQVLGTNIRKGWYYEPEVSKAKDAVSVKFEISGKHKRSKDNPEASKPSKKARVIVQAYLPNSVLERLQDQNDDPARIDPSLWKFNTLQVSCVDIQKYFQLQDGIFVSTDPPPKPKTGNKESTNLMTFPKKFVMAMGVGCYFALCFYCVNRLLSNKAVWELIAPQLQSNKLLIQKLGKPVKMSKSANGYEESTTCWLSGDVYGSHTNGRVVVQGKRDGRRKPWVFHDSHVAVRGESYPIDLKDTK